MRTNDPASWADAVFVDEALRATARAERFGGEMYLHNSMTPLSKVALSRAPQAPPAFGDECEGMCGV